MGWPPSDIHMFLCMPVACYTSSRTHTHTHVLALSLQLSHFIPYKFICPDIHVCLCDLDLYEVVARLPSCSVCLPYVIHVFANSLSLSLSLSDTHTHSPLSLLISLTLSVASLSLYALKILSLPLSLCHCLTPSYQDKDQYKDKPLGCPYTEIPCNQWYIDINSGSEWRTAYKLVRMWFCCVRKHEITLKPISGPLFTGWMNVLPQDIVKYRSHKIRV